MPKKVVEPTIPDWILSEEWAIGINTYNWKLYRRAHNRKTNKPGIWSPIAYFPTAEQLFNSLHRKITRTTSTLPLLDHIKAAQELAENLLETYLEQTKAIPYIERPVAVQATKRQLKATGFKLERKVVSK